MSGSDKKTRSREAFTAVFEEQTRRFSAFELLGIRPEAPSPSLPPRPTDSSPTAWLNPAVKTVPSEQASPLKADSVFPEALPDKPSDYPVTLRGVDDPALGGKGQALRTDSHTQVLRTEGLAEGQRVDSQQGQTPDRRALGRTVWPSLGQTQARATVRKKKTLGTDRPSREPSESVLLAPLQWAVWLILQEADASHRLISYRTIAKETEATMEGVRKAVRVLEKEKLVVRKDTVRTAEEQGFRVVVDATRSVQKGTLNEAKAILKRGLSIEQTTDRQGKVLGTDGLRLFVCNNINIKQTDVASLLRVPPPNWKIREQTLIQIADTHPDMTAIEFRLSLLYLIEQGKQAKEPIRNPNAWIKAAFEKNGGPLVTEREIEARFEQASPTHTPQPVKETGQGGTEEIELLRWYLACGPEERAEIDRSAEEKAAPLLAVIAEDKRAGVLEEARLEAIRERVAKLT